MNAGMPGACASAASFAKRSHAERILKLEKNIVHACELTLHACAFRISCSRRYEAVIAQRKVHEGDG